MLVPSTQMEKQGAREFNIKKCMHKEHQDTYTFIVSTAFVWTDRTREGFILTSWFRKTLYNSSGEVRKVSFIVKDTVEILTPVLGAFFVVEDSICGGTKTCILNFDTELKY